jgi:hypothetical protein
MRGAALLGLALIAGGCASPRSNLAEARPVQASRALSSGTKASSVRLAGSLRRLVVGHPSIRVVLEADCAEMTGFLLEHSLDAEAAVSGSPGEMFHARVSSVRKPDLRPGGVSTGTIALDVDNPDGRILPGRMVAIMFHSRTNPLILLGASQMPDEDGVVEHVTSARD